MQNAAAQIHPRIADGAVCLPPNLSACARLRRTLAQIAPGKLPPILTFRQIAAAVRVLPAADPEQILRAAQLGDPDPPDDDDTLDLFAALRENSPRPPAADLQRAADYAKFFREMDERNLKLPATEAETLAQIAAADSPAARAALSEIAAEIFKLWRDFHAAENSPAAQHRRALAKLADQWKRPLFLAGPESEREPMEAAFCERIQKRGGECVRIPPDESLAAQFARDALNGKSTNGIGKNIDILRAHFSNYREGGAASLTEAAELALSAVAEFARDGAKKIGAVTLDRTLARRVNAMANAAGKTIADRHGWRAETLAFGAALRMMTDAGADPFSPDALSERLRAPPLFAGQNFSREQADHEWRKLLQNELRLPTRLDDFSDSHLSHLEFPSALRAAAEMLERLRKKFSGRRTPAEWLNITRNEADSKGGILHKWRGADPVADRVMELLARAERTAAQSESAMLDAPAFRAWLSHILKSQVRVAEDADADGVFFVSPVGAVMRKFDALILLGGGADYLPGTPSFPLLSERERRALGLPGRGDNLARLRERFCGWIGECDKVALVWRGAGGREETPPSPYWELLKDGLKRAGILPEGFAPLRGLASARPAENISPPSPAVARLEKLPASISATACDRLMECPYLFFARDILKLADDDADDAPSAALIGSAAHKALSKFAAKETDETDAEKIQHRLERILAGLSAGCNRPGFDLIAGRWRARAHMFAEWESRRRLLGWRTVAREENLRTPTKLENGAEIILRGRLDRVDEMRGDDRALAIVDYKTGAVPTLAALDGGEVSQLPLYAAMKAAADGDEKEVAEWLLCRPFPRRGEKSEVFPKSGGGGGGGRMDSEGRRRFADAVMLRFCGALSAMSSGAVLRASGLPSSCARCSARGLCRREHWAGE